jgi:hypothetical protein
LTQKIKPQVQDKLWNCDEDVVQHEITFLY